MENILALWLPILLSAVAVFFASFATWALLPFHNQEYKPLPNEDAALSAIRAWGVPPGEYMFPHIGCGKDGNTPEAKAIMAKGPIGLLRIWPGMHNMGKNMALSFGFNLICAFFVAYVAAESVAQGASFLRVFQIVTTVTFMAYGFGAIPNGIWFAKSGRAHALDLIDAAAFAILTGAIFGLLWPAAQMPDGMPTLGN